MADKNEKIVPQNIYGLTIEQLDRKDIDEIGKRFEEGHTNSAIVTYLANKGLEINRFKIAKYRRKNFPHTLSEKVKKAIGRSPKNKQKLAVVDYEQETENIVQEIQNLPDSLAIQDKGLYVDALITKVNARIRHFDEMFIHTNKGGFNPKLDSIYQKYIEIGKDLVESKARLAGEIDSTNVTVVNVVDSEISLLLDKIKRIVEKVAPEHIGEFRDELLKLYTKNETIIDTEVVSENQQKNK